jgi:hypothetical protein
MGIWGGSNDVAKNETMNGLRHLRKFVNRKKKTQILYSLQLLTDMT